MLPVVAIVGRPNTGKSTLFNRLVGKRYAIESGIPGTTRDRIYHVVKIHDFPILLVDTGGLQFDKREDIEEDVQIQSRIAVSEADLILFVIDVRQDLNADDFAAADMLRKSKKPIILVANKCDNVKIEEKAFNLYELGLGEPEAVSSLHGFGIDAVEAGIAKELREKGFSETTEELLKDVIHIGFLGRPNVGKSSLINAFLNEKRLIVSSRPGTTRDTTDNFVQYEGKTFNLIDTAGLRRRGKVEEELERCSVIRSLQAIVRCDVGLLILDYENGISKQDMSVCQYILESKKGLIIVVNKSDLMELPEKDKDAFISKVKSRFAFVPWAPLVFVSAFSQKNLFKILDLAMEISEQRKKRILTSELNHFVTKIKYQRPPQSQRGHPSPKILYASQVDVNPPQFVLFVNDAALFHFSYRRYIENRIRDEYGFIGTALNIELKNRQESD